MYDSSITDTPPRAPRRMWLRMFITGLVLWVLTVVVTFITGNPNLVPTLVLLGSFLVPVCFVVWAFGRRHSGEVTAELLFSTFVTGGVLGVLAASLLESYLLHPSPWLFLGVGLIEEAVKLLALAFLTRNLAHKYARDGMILGAAVGFGFAAFESAGYAFTALFTEQGLSLMQLVQTELLRGLLAPVGHGLWTAILGGVLFRTAAVGGRLRLSGALVGWYVVVAGLHALWDASRPIAVWLTLLLTASQVQWALIRMGRVPQPTQAQVHTFTMINWGLLLLDALVGVAILRGRWRQALALDHTQPAPGPTP
jgi:protease PrsW